MNSCNAKCATFIAAALTAMVLASSDARAATLLSDSVFAEYDYPSLGTPYTCGGSCFSPSTFTVGAGVETTGAVDIFSPTFDFSSNQLTITFPNGGAGFNPVSFNGPVFTITSGDLWGSILTVSGILAAADVTVTGNKLAVNWADLSSTFIAGAQIAITFDPIAAVPLPAALPLFATGLGGLGLLGWRRKRKYAALAA